MGQISVWNGNSPIGSRACSLWFQDRSPECPPFLVEKPSGCVVWVYFDPNSLELGPFLYFGGEPGRKLPDIDSRKTAKHSKGNAQGVKAERPNHRVINKGQFTVIDSIEDLWHHLFGDT